MTIALEFDPRAFNRWLNRVAQKQVPFATARALTWTAKDAQAAIRQKVQSSMILRRKWALSGIRIKAAQKRHGLNGMFAEVGSVDWFMADQLGETSNVRKPRSSRYRAIPRKVRRTRASAIPRSKRPKALLSRSNVFVQERVKGRPAIWQRQAKGLKLLYTLTPEQRITPVFSFNDAVAKLAADRFPRHWLRSMNEAVATAK